MPTGLRRCKPEFSNGLVKAPTGGSPGPFLSHYLLVHYAGLEKWNRIRARTLGRSAAMPFVLKQGRADERELLDFARANRRTLKRRAT